ncbi:MAG: hypothetical protein IJ705_02950 [Oscillospiraceae bacterium]|nr:hypothetical protein [Oscillospiraceae bacterium]
MQDRIPLHPGRVRLTPVAGQENTYDMTLADEPQTVGTPLNKATLLTDATAQSILKQITRDSIKLGDLALGDEIQIPVDGNINKFRVVHQGNPDPSFYDASCDGTWLMLISQGESRRWDQNASGSYTQNNDYSAGVHTWLNQVWIDTLEESALNFVKTVKIPYRPGASYTSTTINSGADGLSARAFLPSARELGGYTSGSDEYRISDGRKLDYFDQAASNSSSDPSNSKRTFNGVTYYTRTPAYYAGYYLSMLISIEGYASVTGVTAQQYMQPIIIMDADAYQWPDGTFHDAAQESGIAVDTVNDALSVLSMAAGRAQNYWLISTTRDWVVPATGKYQITCFGGGGGGGYGSSTSSGSLVVGGGGGAGYLAQAIVSLTKGDVYRITIGLGGKSQNAGQATSFGTLVTANGGGAGLTDYVNGQGSAIGGKDNYSLGYLTGYAGNSGNGSYYGIGGGGGFFGVGGNGGAGQHNNAGTGSIFATSGQNGTGFASGGGGGGSGGTLVSSTSGGVGAPGVCIIELLNAEEM